MQFKVLFMDSQAKPLEDLRDIKRMMERSSRFISLSGWSGISAGLCALAGAWLADKEISGRTYSQLELERRLLLIASAVFVSALALAFLFTYRRARINGLPMWDSTARRLLLNTMVPITVGGLFIMGMMYHDVTRFISPACLVFYGLALVHASKYTLGEVRYLGYAEITLGLLNLWILDKSLLIWAIGFGVLHIVYGVWMWLKYERRPSK